jgi:hypothetical protein
MIVTYARPFLQSNKAGLGERWWPEDDAGRKLHKALVDLRGEYHAHAERTAHRRIEIMHGFRTGGRPTVAESWSELSVDELRLLKEVALRQAERFEAEIDRIDLELFGSGRRTKEQANAEYRAEMTKYIAEMRAFAKQKAADARPEVAEAIRLAIPYVRV